MHSIARRLDYVVELGRTIRDLIQCVIAREEHEEKRENKEKFELDDDVGQQDPSMDPEKLVGYPGQCFHYYTRSCEKTNATTIGKN